MRALPSSAAALSLAALLSSAPAAALERELVLSPRVGFAGSTGPMGGPGFVVELGAHYGLNDAFSLYAVGGYTAAFPDAPRGPRHGATLAVGVVYALDVLRVVPYVGLGARGDLMVGAQEGWITPSAEARVGLRWLLRRGFGLSFEAAYAFPFVANDLAADLLTVSVGVSFLRDL
ncbi:MAG: hypothetical protein JWM10_532 [Myxococcaceae bacterium]|nr:hypothetical protein [Myxococcaceae bacterium]